MNSKGQDSNDEHISNNEVPQLFPDECRPLSMCWEINRVNLSRGCKNLCQFCQVCDLSSPIINKVHNPPSSCSPNTQCCATKSYWAALSSEMYNFKLLESTIAEMKSLSDETPSALRPSEILWLMVKLLMEARLFMMEIWTDKCFLYSMYLRLTQIISSVSFLCQQ